MYSKSAAMFGGTQFNEVRSRGTKKNSSQKSSRYSL